MANALILMIGISGSGKSTYVQSVLRQSYPDAAVVSSDRIRGEFFGSEADQRSGEKVFQEVRRRIRRELKAGRDVILDTTALSRKARRSILCDVRSFPDLHRECHVILAPPQDALENQSRRERQVPMEVIYRQMSSFAVPEMSEGFDRIVFYNRYPSRHFDQIMPELLGQIDQTGFWHVEDAGLHTQLVLRAARELNAPDDVMEAALYHDFGKYYTRSEDEKGAHFYGHEHASAYLYLCDKVSGYDVPDGVLDIACLIENHDRLYQPGFNREAFIEAHGEEMLRKLTLLRKADKKGMISRDQYREMPALELMNTFPDWKERLENEPFTVSVRESGDYVLLKYSQFGSDMSYRAAQESRGPIFRKDENGQYIYVCRPFDKFFNYGEPFAAEIDWKTARVTAKIDGSLMKLFYDRGSWHLATNGTIDAFMAPVGDDELSFGEVFERALGADIQTLGSTLDPLRTYMFELTSPETQVVIAYPDGVYYLSCRDNATGEESFERPQFAPGVKIQYPKQYDMTSLEDVIAAAQLMSKDEEGFVVNDAQGRRVKVKSPEYLVAAHLQVNGAVTRKRIFEYIRTEKIDDFLAYVPQHKARVDAVMAQIDAFCEGAERQWKELNSREYESQKEFAEAVKGQRLSPYFFARRKEPSLTPKDYLFRITMPAALKFLAIPDEPDPDDAE